MSLYDRYNHTTHPNCPWCIDGMTPVGIHPDLGPVLRLPPTQTWCGECGDLSVFPAEYETLDDRINTFAGIGWRTTGDALLANTAAAIAASDEPSAARKSLTGTLASSASLLFINFTLADDFPWSAFAIGLLAKGGSGMQPRHRGDRTPAQSQKRAPQLL